MDSVIESSINEEPFRTERSRLLKRGFYEIYYYPPKKKIIIDNFQTNTKYLVEDINILEKETGASALGMLVNELVVKRYKGSIRVLNRVADDHEQSMTIELCLPKACL